MLDPNVINFLIIKIFLLLLRLLFPFIIVCIVIYIINKNLFYRILYAIAGKPWEAYTEKKRKEKEKADVEQRKELEQQRIADEIKRKQEEEKRDREQKEAEEKQREIDAEAAKKTAEQREKDQKDSLAQMLTEMFGSEIIGLGRIFVCGHILNDIQENFFTNLSLRIWFVNFDQEGIYPRYTGVRVDQDCEPSLEVVQEGTKRTLIYNDSNKRCTLEYDVMEGVVVKEGECPFFYMKYLYDKAYAEGSKNGYYYIPYDEHFKFSDSSEMSDIHAINTWYYEYRKIGQYPDIICDYEYEYSERENLDKCFRKYIGNTYNMRLGGAWYSDEKGIYLATYPKMDCFLSGSRFIKKDLWDTSMNSDLAEFWAPKMVFSCFKEYKRILWNIFIPNSEFIEENPEDTKGSQVQGDIQIKNNKGKSNPGKEKNNQNKNKKNSKHKPPHQLDSLAVTQSAIYCIEVKYWKTPISFKDIEHGEWYTDSNTVNHSPVWQNRYHIEKGLKPLFNSENFKKLLGDEEAYNILKNLPIYNVVIFYGSNKIAPLFEPAWQDLVAEYLETHPDVLIGYHQEIFDWLMQSEGNHEKCLSVNQINCIFDILRNPKFVLSQDEQDNVLKEKSKQH